MQQAALSRRMTTAISNLIVDDWRLLTIEAEDVDRPLSERAVACALAWHVKAVMERSWDVDCEYNRAQHGDAASVKRRVGDAPVAPDMLVHRRGEGGEENNLLILELKTDKQRQSHHGGTLQSVREVRERHSYRYGVFLDLGLSAGGANPQWTWINAETPVLQGPVALTPVYRHHKDLEALCRRGRIEERRRYLPVAEN